MLARTDPWPPTGVQVLRRINPAGSVVLAELPAHRVSLHFSPWTDTSCRDTGARFRRLRGHVDVTAAAHVGGFVAEDASESVEVRIPLGFAERVAERSLGSASFGAVDSRHMVEDPRLTHLMLAIDAEREAGFPGGRLYMDSLGVALAVQLLDGQARSAAACGCGSEPVARRVQHAIDFIEANLDRPLSLQQIAKAAGTSASALQRGFKAHKGDSVHRYIVHRRVERARLLLMKRTLPAAEVALAAGFSHQSHMARWMRRLLGVAPGEVAPGATP